MSAQSLIEVLKDIETQLNWKGLNDKVVGHIVIPRAKAEILFRELSALAILDDKNSVANVHLRSLTGEMRGNKDK